MPDTVVIVLLRNDLRIHDQEHFALAHDEVKSADVTHVLPLYVFDERHIELSGLPGYQRQGPEARTRLCGFWRTGVFRLKFMCEAIYDLRSRLRAKGSDLTIRFGKPEDVTANFVKAFQARGDKVKGVYLQKEVCTEEVACERALDRQLKPLGVCTTFFYQNTLVHRDDLPFPVSQISDVFTPYRKRVEALKEKMYRPVVPTPKRFKPVPSLPQTPDYGAELNNETRLRMEVHLLKPLSGHVQQRYDPHGKKSAFPFDGGETAALSRLEWYFKSGGSPPPAAKYKQTRNHLLGHAYSTKMSPYLCLGSVSPRLIIQYLHEHEKEFGSSQNTYWIQFELLWRDYFLLVSEKFGSRLFKLGGFEEVTDPKNAAPKLEAWNDWNPKDDKLVRWMEGRTGVPFIDANMIELIQSGFMSNRGRQNVASFLTKDLYYDWRIGAEYFESHLIDYEPCANYGNWQYVSGVGNDPRASRQFNPIKQGKDYDVHGSFVKHWLPQLSRIPSAKVHVPWILDEEERKQYSLREGSYPLQPILVQSSWEPHFTRGQHDRTKLRGNNAERVRDSKNGTAQARAAGSNKHLKVQQPNTGHGTDSDRPSYSRSDDSNSSTDNNVSGSQSGSQGDGANQDSAKAGSAAPQKKA